MFELVLRKLAPISVAIGFTVVCLVVKENYPFSHYPMYSNFDDQTYYVWLADGEGNPIASEKLTYHRLGKIKKMYNDDLQEVRTAVGKKVGKKPRKRDLTLEQRRGPADATLQCIYDNSRPAAQNVLLESAPLRLYQVDIRVEGNAVVEDPAELVGELSREQLTAGATP